MMQTPKEVNALSSLCSSISYDLNQSTKLLHSTEIAHFLTYLKHV